LIDVFGIRGLVGPTVLEKGGRISKRWPQVDILAKELDHQVRRLALVPWSRRAAGGQNHMPEFLNHASQRVA